jgi:hypothetical protein
MNGRHLRVSAANQKETDTKTTIFVGNLPFTSDEEEVRKYFKDAGAISYIRMIRDPRTHQGKGICYIKYEDIQGYLNGLKKNLKWFGNRQIRVSKAMLMGDNKKPLNASEARKQMKPRWSDESKKIAKELRGHNSKEEREDFKAITELVSGAKSEMFDYEMENLVENHTSGMGITLVGQVPQSSISKQIKKIKKKQVSGFGFNLKKSWIRRLRWLSV